MTRIITIIISLISINCVHAQWADNNSLYLSGDLHLLGNYGGIDLNINYINKDDYTFRLGLSGYQRSAKSLPQDYSSGLVGMMLYGLTDPSDHLGSFYVGFGKIHKLNERGTIRGNLSLGLGYTNINEPVNWVKNNDGFFGENYTWSEYKFNTISLIINPKIEFPFTRFFGLSASPMLQINKDRTYIGIGLGTMIGLLRS